MNENYATILYWKDEDIYKLVKEKIKDFKYNILGDLILQMLRVNPQDRIDIDTVLKHKFFDTDFSQSEAELMALLKSMDRKQDVMIRKLDEISEMSKEILKKTEKIESLSAKALVEMSRNQKILLKGIYEATGKKNDGLFLEQLLTYFVLLFCLEVHTPTCFVILNHEIKRNPDEGVGGFLLKTEGSKIIL